MYQGEMRPSHTRICDWFLFLQGNLVISHKAIECMHKMANCTTLKNLETQISLASFFFDFSNY